MSRLLQPGFVLDHGGRRLDPISLDRNRVGVCQSCGGELESMAYHRNEEGYLVSAKCRNDHLVLISYDLSWSWREDLKLEISSSFARPSDLSKEQLEAVFTPAEIRTLLACERGETYLRQNLYRARAKYDKLEKLFGVRINL